MKRVAAGEFKATCLKLMDRVAQTGEPVEVTKRGKPLVRLVAAAEPTGERRRSVFGAARDSFVYLAPDAELSRTGAEWHAGR